MFSKFDANQLRQNLQNIDFLPSGAQLDTEAAQNYARL